MKIHTKCILLSRDFIWLNITYGKNVSRWEHTKSDSYIPQDEDVYDKWARVKIDPVKTENVNIEQNFKTKQVSRGGEDVKYIQNTTKNI